MLIGITGATGFLGRHVAQSLAADGHQLRLIVRDPSRVDAAGNEVAQASYGDTEQARAALAGVDVLFMVSAAEAADRVAQHTGFVDAAAASGVRHIVYTSFLGAAPDATFTLARDHWATEQHIAASGMTWTFLRDSFYLDFLPLLAGEDGVIRGPAGQGRVAAVAREDVARSAAAVLASPDAHAGVIYDLTGREAYTLAEAAAITTRITGRDVSYLDETIEQAYESRAPYGAPDWQVDAWVSTYTAIAAGELATISDHVERLTGRPPLTLAEFLAS